MTGSRPDIKPQGTRALTPQRLALLAGTLVLVTLMVYWPAIHAGFIWDDDSYVTENQLLRSLDGLFRIWIPGNTPQYYPLVFSTFWIEYHIWQLDPLGYHLVNILIHIASALLVWRLFTKLGVPGAWLIAAIFALHPMQVESVAWITERKNVLSTLFYLGAALTYFRFEDEREKSDGRFHREAAGWYGLTLIFFVFALLSKTVTASLPAALILALVYQRRRFSVRRIACLAPMFVIGLALGLVTIIYEQQIVGAAGAEFDFTFIERCLIASNALLFYPYKMLFPWPVMFIYPRWEIDPTQALSYWPAIVVLLAAAVCIWLFVRGRRGPALAAAFYAGTVFPAIGFFNVYPHKFSFVADHFNYLSALGIIALVIGTLHYLVPKRKQWSWLAGPVVLVLAGLTYQRATVFENAETVWRDTLEKNPTSWMPNDNLAAILLEKAEQARLANNREKMLELAGEAEYYARRAVEAKPDQHTARSNLAEALRLQGAYDEALTHIQKAIERADHLAQYHWQRGRLHELRNDTESAIEAYRQAVQRAPDVIRFRMDLGRLFMQQQRFDSAGVHYRAVVERNTNHVEAKANLAIVREQQQRFGDARHLYEQIVQQRLPASLAAQIIPRYIRFLTNCPDEQYRDFDRARELANRLNDMAGGNDPGAMALLATVHAATGDYEQAIATARNALSIAEQRDLPQLVSHLQTQITQYEEQRDRTSESSDE